MPPTLMAKPRFIRHDLMSTDPSRAKTFYGGLLGWKLIDLDIGGVRLARIVGAEERVLGAIFTLPRGEATSSYWLGYVGPAEVDAVAKLAVAEGGAQSVPGTNVAFGRFAVLTDPQGAAFGVLTPKDAPPPPIDRADAKPGWFCWDDLFAPEVSKARYYYERVFGWSAAERGGRGNGRYILFSDGPKGLGGCAKLQHGTRANWVSYVMVADLAASTQRAASLGAKIVVDQASILGVGRVTMLIDPTGAPFALCAKAPAI